ncbi:MAG: hypothetical protein ABEJ26_07015 [Halosimplex sp.]
MHVYCTDGTVFECARYEANEYGLVLYGTERQRDRERYETEDPQQVGFVPHDRLWYVLPKGVTPGGAPVPDRSARGQQLPRGGDAVAGSQPR